MPAVPRQGRKGDKISASPALAMTSASPSSLSPGTLPPSILANVPLPPHLAAAMQATSGNSNSSTSAQDGSAATATPLLDWRQLLDSRRLAAAAVAASSGGGGAAANSNNNDNNNNGTASGDTEKAATGDGHAAATAPSAAAPLVAAAAAAAPSSSSSFDGSVLKIDASAIRQVGQGVVIGGSKTVRVRQTRPSASADAVRDKLRGMLVQQQQLQHGSRERTAAAKATTTPQAWLAAVQTHDVTLLRHAFTTLALTAAVGVGVRDACVLVVLPRYDDVATVAQRLRVLCARELRAMHHNNDNNSNNNNNINNSNDAGEDVHRATASMLVGEMCGSAYVGAASSRVWVSCAETAFCLYGQPTLPPFTHVVFAGLTRTTPLLACFLLALRERLHRWNSAHADAPAQLRWLVCPDDGDVLTMRAFFSASARVCVLDATSATPTYSDVANGSGGGGVDGDDAAAAAAATATMTAAVPPLSPAVLTFSSDECHALAEMNAVTVAEDRVTRRGGPHHRTVEHLTQLAARVVRAVVCEAEAATRATVSLCIYVIVPEVTNTVAALAAAKLPRTRLYASHTRVTCNDDDDRDSDDSDSDSDDEDSNNNGSDHARARRHRVYVMSYLEHLHSHRHTDDDENDDVVHVVVDAGCVRRAVVPSNTSEHFLRLTATEWASRSDVRARQAVAETAVLAAASTWATTTDAHAGDDGSSGGSGSVDAAQRQRPPSPPVAAYLALYSRDDATQFVTASADGAAAAADSGSGGGVSSSASSSSSLLYDTQHDIEAALLRCVRAGVPLEYARAALFTVSDDVVAAALAHLHERLFVTDAQTPAVTLLGEAAARLPLHTDVAYLALIGCALGVGDVAVVLACLCAVPLRVAPPGMAGSGSNSGGNNADTVTTTAGQQQQQQRVDAYRARVLRGRTRYAGALAGESDLLADALLFCEWCRRRALLLSQQQQSSSSQQQQQDQGNDDAMRTAARHDHNKRDDDDDDNDDSDDDKPVTAASLRAWVRRVGLRSRQLHEVAALVRYVAAQLRDYTFVDSLDRVEAAVRAAQTLRGHAALLSFLIAASLTRHVAVVRDADATSSRSPTESPLLPGGGDNNNNDNNNESNSNSYSNSNSHSTMTTTTSATPLTTTTTTTTTSVLRPWTRHQHHADAYTTTTAGDEQPHKDDEDVHGGFATTRRSNSHRQTSRDGALVATATASLLFVRTAKRVVCAADAVSAVPWPSHTAVVAVHLRNRGATCVTGTTWSRIRVAYCYVALLLLYARVEYSSPVAVSGHARVVYMAVTCNGQMRRFALPIADAARLLDAREAVVRVVQALYARRCSATTTRAHTSRRRFVLEAQKRDAHFDLDAMQQAAQQQLTSLAMDTDVVEQQGVFDTLAVHSLAGKTAAEDMAALEQMPECAAATDVAMAQHFCNGSLFATTTTTTMTDASSGGGTLRLLVTSPASLLPPSSSLPGAPPTSRAAPATSTTTTAIGVPASAAAAAAAAAAALASMPLATYVEDDEDDIEVYGESYFAKYGPLIIEDDDDDDDADTPPPPPPQQPVQHKSK